jgi:hypothetical protein
MANGEYEEWSVRTREQRDGEEEDEKASERDGEEGSEGREGGRWSMKRRRTRVVEEEHIIRLGAFNEPLHRLNLFRFIAEKSLSSAPNTSLPSSFPQRNRSEKTHHVPPRRFLTPPIIHQELHVLLPIALPLNPARKVGYVVVASSEGVGGASVVDAH